MFDVGVIHLFIHLAFFILCCMALISEILASACRSPAIGPDILGRSLAKI